MTIRPTDDRITSDVTPHTATRQTPNSWVVSWLDRRLDRNRAITAMLIAEEALTASRGNLLSDATLKSCRLIDDLASELDLTGEQAIDLIRETLPPAPVHDTHAIPATDEPSPTEGFQPGDWVDVTLRHAMVERVTHDDGEVILTFGHEAMSDVVAVVLNDDITATARTEAEVHADHAAPVADAAAALARLGDAYNEAGTL